MGRCSVDRDLVVVGLTLVFLGWVMARIVDGLYLGGVAVAWRPALLVVVVVLAALIVARNAVRRG